MKKILSLIVFLLAICLHAQTYYITTDLTPAVTSIAANSTNTTAGTAYNFTVENKARTGRMFLSCTAPSVQTNGALTVYFTTSFDRSGTNTFDTATLSNLKLSLTSLSTNASQVSDWFYLGGVSSIRIDRIENTFGVACSNIVVKANFRTDK